MKCTVLVSEKMNGLPIAECGGVCLTSNDELYVKSELAAKLLKAYAPRLARAGDIEVNKLAHGSYELKRASTKLFGQNPKAPSSDTVAVDGLAADKSMQSKAKVKKKA